MLDATETSAALEAARAGLEAPEPDTQRRAELAKELDSAVAREFAAKRALPSLDAEIQREAGKRPGLEKAKSATIAEIIAEEVAALVDDFSATNAKLAKQAQALSEIREQILIAVEAGGERDGYVRLEALDGKLSWPPNGRLSTPQQSAPHGVASRHALRFDAGALAEAA